MATYRVESAEETTGGNVNCDTYVLNDAEEVIGHFTVVLNAADVLDVAGLTKAERVAAYKALFSADPRIAKTVDSESAAAQMRADVPFPVTVDL